MNVKGGWPDNNWICGSTWKQRKKLNRSADSMIGSKYDFAQIWDVETTI